MMDEEQPFSNANFVLLQLWGSYLMEYDHNTYEEVMGMTFEQMEARFREVTNTNNGVEVV